ncbi:MAG: hypothetical protein IMZ50_10800, partial [Candidatus Atribacteria bacterium]|nr:hypothetical protein [Candidatus Atribacteria bacterium]
MMVPKDPDRNLQYRLSLLKSAEADEGFQRELWSACASSILFFVNAFAFTFNIRKWDETGQTRQASNVHLPFVTWEIQDQHLLEIEKAINEGHDLLTDKTREMGASWDHVVTFHHQWLFKADRLFLEISRVETDVDGADNPRCLFVKHDYLNRWLPPWIRPPDCLPSESARTKMHIVNVLNRSRIDGESSNKAAGSGDRRHAVLLDEFAKCENATKIKAAIADVTACRLVNSTPWGAGTAYAKWKKSGTIKVFTLPWWEHPDKGRGRRTIQNPDTQAITITSPWYEQETKRRDRREMAQEVDMNDMASGAQYFDAIEILRHKQLFGKPALFSRNIDWVAKTPNESIPAAIMRSQLSLVQVTPGRTWRFWTRLIDGRLDQTKHYVFGIDISKGQGASNSV